MSEPRLVGASPQAVRGAVGERTAGCQWVVAGGDVPLSKRPNQSIEQSSECGLVAAGQCASWWFGVADALDGWSRSLSRICRDGRSIMRTEAYG
jgi:hypothetical protein